MLAKNRMVIKHHTISIQAQNTVEEALKILVENEVDSVPVLDGEKYVGMISQFEIYKQTFNSDMRKHNFINDTLIGEIATRKNVFVKEDDLLESTIHTLKDFPSVAVVDSQNHFLGVVTRFDVVEMFQEAMGKDRKGVRILMTCLEKEGQLAKLFDMLHHYHENIISLITFDTKDDLMRRILIKIDEQHRTDKVLEKLESLGFRIVDVKYE